MTIDSKVALITGAGQGVGQGIAFALAKAGAKVAVAGRTLGKLESTCHTIHQNGGQAMAVECNVKDEQSLQACVDTVIESYGGINILVNNAQEVPLGNLLDVAAQDFDAGLQSGPVATFNLMKLCYPHLKGDGVIVNLATAAAKRWDMSGYGAYAACKEAIRSISRAAACEWGPEGIRTNVILPLAASPALAEWIHERPEETQQYFQTIPQRRVGDCEADIGAFVVMLCGPQCGYVNGQSIALDGGQVFLG